MELKVKRLCENAILPTKTNNSDAGYDLYASEDVKIFAGNRKIVKTGIALEIPVGYAGLIWPRSGLSVKYGLDVLAGVIDAGYRGEIMVCLLNTETPIGDEGLDIKAGDRIAQILFQPVPHFDLVEIGELTESQRGVDGFGSSGK
jgi:dUTP pyrophosphatase